jgi:multidrug efflux pump subunit AcrB
MVALAAPDGTLVKLDRIANIKDAFTEKVISGRFNGKPAALLGVCKTPKEDAIAISRAVARFVEEHALRLPPGVHLTLWADLSRMIQQRIDMLKRYGRIGLIFVILLLWFFLDLRLSFWVAMGIPVSLAGAIVLLVGTGRTLDRLSLFGMIMTLGLIVDDAIVVGESIYFHRTQGKPPLRAAIDGTLEVAWPVIAAVVTTIIAFIPLFFVKGIIGKFIAVIPFVVIAALVTSLLECLFILPAHLNALPEIGREAPKPSLFKRISTRFRRWVLDGMSWFLDRLYSPLLLSALRWRYCCLAMALGVMLTSAGLVQGGHIRYVFMPNNDQDFLFASVEFPDGTPSPVTQGAIAQMEEGLRSVARKVKTSSGEPLIRAMYSMVSRSSLHYGKKGVHRGHINVELLPSERRGIFYQRILDLWKEESGSVVGALSLRYVPIVRAPGGKPIEIWLLGRDMEALLRAAKDLEVRLRMLKGVYSIEDDFRPGKKELRARLRPTAHTLGLTVADLANQLYSGFFGSETVRIQRGRDEVKVKVRYPLEERRSLSGLESVRIRTPAGAEVPLASVADVSIERGYDAIKRKDGMRRIVVTAEVNKDVANAKQIMSEMRENFLPALTRLHPGVFYTIEGQEQSTKESLQSLYVGFAIAMVGIFVILAAIFHSYLQALMIMIAVPFGFIGAVIGHVVLGYDLTIMSVFGMLALTGIVVNDAIVMVDCINHRIAKGEPLFSALEHGSRRRFRAIILTTVTTCAGLTPLIAEKSMQAQILIPMAISIVFGVAVATLLTLLLLPCLITILNDIRRLATWILTGRYPSRESVEPAASRAPQRRPLNQQGVDSGDPRERDAGES